MKWFVFTQIQLFNKLDLGRLYFPMTSILFGCVPKIMLLKIKKRKISK